MENSNLSNIWVYHWIDTDIIYYSNVFLSYALLSETSLWQSVVKLLKIFRGNQLVLHRKKRDWITLRLAPQIRTNKEIHLLFIKKRNRCLIIYYLRPFFIQMPEAQKLACKPSSFPDWSRSNTSALLRFTNLKDLLICRMKGHHLLISRLRKWKIMSLSVGIYAL